MARKTSDGTKKSTKKRVLETVAGGAAGVSSAIATRRAGHAATKYANRTMEGHDYTSKVQTRLSKSQQNRATKWNNKHAGPVSPIRSGSKRMAKKEKNAGHISSRRQLFHGTTKPHEAYRPSEHAPETMWIKTPGTKRGHGDGVLFATHNHHIAEHYALGGRGALAKKNRDRGYVAGISRSENHKFQYGGHQYHKIDKHPFVSKDDKIAVFRDPQQQRRRKATGHTIATEHPSVSGQTAHSSGGYWVHRNKATSKIHRYESKPRTGQDVYHADLKHAKHAGYAVAGVAAVGATAYGIHKYREHRHRQQLAPHAHDHFRQSIHVHTASR